MLPKNTSLPISIIGYEVNNSNENSEDSKKRLPIYEYSYEFDTITEEDFIEPNISEYEVQN